MQSPLDSNTHVRTHGVPVVGLMQSVKVGSCYRQGKESPGKEKHTQRHGFGLSGVPQSDPIGEASELEELGCSNQVHVQYAPMPCPPPLKKNVSDQQTTCTSWLWTW